MLTYRITTHGIIVFFFGRPNMLKDLQHFHEAPIGNAQGVLSTMEAFPFVNGHEKGAAGQGKRHAHCPTHDGNICFVDIWKD